MIQSYSWVKKDADGYLCKSMLPESGGIIWCRRSILARWFLAYLWKCTWWKWLLISAQRQGHWHGGGSNLQTVSSQEGASWRSQKPWTGWILKSYQNHTTIRLGWATCGTDLVLPQGPPTILRRLKGKAGRGRPHRQRSAGFLLR